MMTASETPQEPAQGGEQKILQVGADSSGSFHASSQVNKKGRILKC